MKLVMAIIKPSRLDAVLDAASEAGVSGLTVTEVRGYGRPVSYTHLDVYKRQYQYILFLLIWYHLLNSHNYHLNMGIG